MTSRRHFPSPRSALLAPAVSRGLSAVVVLSGLLGVSCGGATPAATSAGAPSAADLFPLAEGNVWTYDAYDHQGNGPTLAGIRVARALGPRFTLRSIPAGEVVGIYEQRDGGLFAVDAGSWLLRDPLTLGAEWDAKGRRRARVDALDVAVEVPRGRFEGCVRVVETGGQLDLHIATTYCPGVGVVLTESSMASELTDAPLTQRAALREYVVDAPPDADADSSR